MKATHTIFEHERYPFVWDEHHLLALNRLNHALGTEVLQAATHRGRRVLKAGSYVGVVRLGRLTFQVLPKIDYGEDRTQSATRNLLFLLEQVGQFPVRRQEIAPLLSRGQSWFEILTRLLAMELKVQWQRGTHSHYQPVEATLPALKGKWRIHEQLRQPVRHHLFNVVYDEFTPDNELNRVFRFVVERLWRQTSDTHNRRLLGELRQWLDGVTLLPTLTAQAAAPNLITRLNARFEPLLNLARLFLGGGTVEMAAGDVNTFAFVFDMNALFEAFLIRFLQRYCTTILPTELADCRLLPQTRHFTRHLAVTEAGRGAYRLQPDLALQRGSRFPLLVDMKYKKLKEKIGRSTISQADFYQMFAYSCRYDCPHVLLLYPQTDALLRSQYRVVGETAVIAAATVNLHRDLSGGNGRHALMQELRDIFTREVNDVPAG